MKAKPLSRTEADNLLDLAIAARATAADLALARRAHRGIAVARRADVLAWADLLGAIMDVSE